MKTRVTVWNEYRHERTNEKGRSWCGAAGGAKQNYGHIPVPMEAIVSR